MKEKKKPFQKRSFRCVLYVGASIKPVNMYGRAKIKTRKKILCTMIASYADKRVGYNTLWETKCGGVGGERNFSDV
jgi:hypothetical protein